MNDRRIFLKSLAPFAAAVAMPVSSKAHTDQCRFYADKLQDAMREQYGGEWDVTLQPENGSIFGRRLSS
jgi:hypothetical protein